MSIFAVPARELSYLRDLKTTGQPLVAEKPVWPLDAAGDAIAECAREGAAISQGQILVLEGDVLSPLPWESDEHRDDGILTDTNGPSVWKCWRGTEERWADYQRRSTAHAIEIVRALTTRARFGGDTVVVDLAWVTEDELALFDLPGWSRAGLDASIESGRAPLVQGSSRRVALARPVAGSFYGGATSKPDEIPLDARYAWVGRAADLRALRSQPSLEVLHLMHLNAKAVATLGSLGGLRVLFAGDTRLKSLAGLESMASLEALTVGVARQLTDFSALYGLHRLRVLRVVELWLEDLTPLAALTQLVGLHIHPHRAPASLAPLAALKKLRALEYWGGARDGSLAPLGALSQLEWLEVRTASFTLDAFAELAAALPETEGPHRSPFIAPLGWQRQIVRCACGASPEGYTLGKPTKLLCATCSPERVARHVAKWEILVSAARARRV